MPAKQSHVPKVFWWSMWRTYSTPSHTDKDPRNSQTLKMRLRGKRKQETARETGHTQKSHKGFSDLKSIRVHLDPRSQLVCVLTQTLVIVTTVRIFVANLRVESARVLRRVKYTHGKGHIPLTVSGISILCLWDIQQTFDW